MSQRRAFQLGFSADRGESAIIGMTSLVDILVATIGIFVIVFALQEISEIVNGVPLPYDGLVLCDDAGVVTAYIGSAEPMIVPIDALAETLPDLMPNGGTFLVGVAGVCAQASADGRSSIAGILSRTAEGLMQLDDEKGSSLHEFEFAPLGEPPNDAASLRKRWIADSSQKGFSP